jgi:hypothetical protein
MRTKTEFPAFLVHVVHMVHTKRQCISYAPPARGHAHS